MRLTSPSHNNTCGRLLFNGHFNDLLPSFTPIEGLEVHKDRLDQRIQFFHVTCASGP